MLVSEFELQISDDHDGIIDLPADAPVGQPYAKYAGLDDAGDRHQPDAEPARLHRRQRHRARSRRGRHRRVQGAHAEADQGRIPLPGLGEARLRPDPSAVPGVRAPPRARRQERPVAGVAAEAAQGHRPSPDQRAGRHHQLHHLRPRPAAARVRRQEGEGQSRRAPRAERRAGAGARRQDLHARQRHVRDRRRQRRRVARRHHGRRGLGLRREHHRRADRIGAVGAAQHRPDRAQARHQLRRALPLRARRRSELHAAGAGARHADGDGALRRHAVGGHRRRQGGSAGKGHRLPDQRIEAARRPRSQSGRDAARAATSSASSSPARTAA